MVWGCTAAQVVSPRTQAWCQNPSGWAVPSPGPCAAEVAGEDLPIESHHPQFQLFKELVDGTLWKSALRHKGAEQTWWLFKEIFLRVQELSILVC